MRHANGTIRCTSYLLSHTLVSYRWDGVLCMDHSDLHTSPRSLNPPRHREVTLSAVTQAIHIRSVLSRRSTWLSKSTRGRTLPGATQSMTSIADKVQHQIANHISQNL